MVSIRVKKYTGNYFATLPGQIRYNYKRMYSYIRNGGDIEFLNLDQNKTLLCIIESNEYKLVNEKDIELLWRVFRAGGITPYINKLGKNTTN